jgi:hypothetical protein
VITANIWFLIFCKGQTKSNWIFIFRGRKKIKMDWHKFNPTIIKKTYNESKLYLLIYILFINKVYFYNFLFFLYFLFDLFFHFLITLIFRINFVFIILFSASFDFVYKICRFIHNSSRIITWINIKRKNKN